MNGKLRNMTSLYLKKDDSLLLLYRIGSKVIDPSYTGSAGGHFEKDELNDAESSAQYVISHYVKIGKDNEKLYAGIATESGVKFSEMREF